MFLRFLRFGALAWGGPVAQIALMHRELVERDAWVSEERFVKTLAVYQALPGPEATELAVYFGYRKRGRWGGLMGGLGFVLPGLVLVLAAALLYTTVLPDRSSWDTVLYGARPAVLALVAVGLVRLARASIRSRTLALVALGAGLGYALLPGVSFLAFLVGAGGVALGATVIRARRCRARPDEAAARLSVLLAAVALPLALSPAFLWVFAKCGLLTFGGAYTIIPILQDGAVRMNAWITQEQLLDAMAITGILPTPFVSVGSFVGYQAAGALGYAAATVLVFLPAFAFTLAGHHALERLVHEPRLHAFLVGVTAGVIGILGASLVPLGTDAIVDAPTAVLALGAFALLQWVKVVPRPFVLALAAAAGAVWRIVA